MIEGLPASQPMPTRLPDPGAVQAQIRRLSRSTEPGGAQAPWLHREVARRMAERLSIVLQRPQRIAVWSAALGGGAELLRERYPEARRWIVEPSSRLVERSRRAEEGRWWRLSDWRGRRAEVLRDDEALPTDLGLVWSNMALHAVSDPPALIERWHRSLGEGGFVMFSCLGPGSLADLRAIYREAGWPPPGIEFVDMHDYGDMLLRSGFADPVMDQETLTLTWPDGEALLAELRSLGGNVSAGRGAGLRTPRWKGGLLRRLEALRRADGRLALRFEVAYGHAFKAAPRRPPSPQTHVSLEAMRSLVKAPRSGG